jgi:hypothetical protein
VLLGVVQALPGWQLLVLKLLSLQGSKDSVNLCQLAVVPASGDEAQQASAGAGQQQQQGPLSQMDELRLLNESVAKQGELNIRCRCISNALRSSFSLAFHSLHLSCCL